MGQVVQLFSNPASGRHSRRKIADLAAALEARGASVLMCESAGGTPHIAEEATHVCVAGGDGTVRHVADAVIRQRRAVALSIYPAGTALTDDVPVVPAKLHITPGAAELGPACDQCGGMMQRTGACYTCSSCGNNTGCG